VRLGLALPIDQHFMLDDVDVTTSDMAGEKKEI
jgi:hypothetical protein